MNERTKMECPAFAPERELTPEQIRSRRSMERLSREYHESADKLRARAAHLQEMMRVMPPEDRKIVEERLAVLRQEIRECDRTGDEVGEFYLPGHRFLPRSKKHAAWPGAYIC